jgi:mRNA interferase MazF
MSRTFPRRGEIWQVQLPDETKRRPALIISVNSRNEFSNSVLVVPLTTNLKPSPAHVMLPAGQGGLRHASMARCENLGYLRKDRLNRAGFSGAISAALLRQIEAAILRALGIAPNTASTANP